MNESACTLFSRARHGLWHGVGAIGLRPGDEVIAPAYHHGSEIEALTRAGLICRFYDASPTLEPDEAELEGLLTPGTRALYLIHYLGFPQDATRWRAWCDERGLRFIEDAAQSWLSSHDGRPVGSLGDLSLFCLYKSIGLPDGAAVVGGAPPVDGTRAKGLESIARRHIAWLVGRTGLRARRNGGEDAESGYVAERDFALGDPNHLLSSATSFLARRVDTSAVAARRRANYELLLVDLDDHVPAPFNRLTGGASPFVFPIETDDKRELLARLGQEGIRAINLWSEPHPSLPRASFPGAARRRARTIGLPVHQELRLQDVERIAGAASRRSARPPHLLLDAIDDLDALAGKQMVGDWNDLALAAGNIFATWEWSSTWWRHFGAGRLLATGCRTRDDRLAAVLPLYRSRRSALETVRFLGHGPADQLGPVCAPGDRAEAARALRARLASEGSNWDVFVGDLLPANEGWSALLAAKTVQRHANPVVRFRGRSWADLLASHSSAFRKQVAYQERRLARQHGLRYRLADDPTRLGEDLDTLFALHAARWRSSAFIRDEAFHREFASVALKQGWLRLWVMELEGEAVAAWYGFRFADVESHYQGGRNPEWDRLSVGSVLLMHTLRAALDDGVREYRLLRGAEAYKYRLANDDPGLETMVLSRGLLGRAAATPRAVARRLF